VIRTSVLILVLALALTAARDLVCQLGCAKPDAAHASATCHESGDMGKTLLSSQETIHCAAVATETTTGTIKLTVAREQASLAAVAVEAIAQPVAVTIDLVSSSRARKLAAYPRPTVLRI
jgi:hypothetical protein